MLKKAFKLTSLLIIAMVIFYFISENPSNVVVKKPVKKSAEPILANLKHSNVKEISLSPSSCKVFVNLEKINSSSRNVKRKKIKKFIKQLQITNIPEDIIDSIAIDSGVGLLNARQWRKGYKIDNYQMPLQSNQQVKATKEEQDLLTLLLQTDKQKEILNAIKNNKLNFNHVFSGKWHYVSLLGYIIESNNSKKEELIRNLLVLNFDILFLDLITATRERLSLDLIIKMHQQSGINVDRNFAEVLRLHSLTTLALNKGQPQLAEYWLSQKSSHTPDKFGPTAIDVLAHRGEMYNQLEFQLLLQKLIELDTKSNMKRTATRMKKLLTKSEFNNHREIFDRFTHKLTQNQNKEVKINVDKLHKIVLDNWVSFDINKIPKHECLSILGRTITKKLLKKKNKKSKRQKYSPPKKPSLDPLIIKAQSMFSNNMEIENELSKNGGLEGKILINNFRKHIISKLGASQKKEFDTLSKTEEGKTIIEVIALAKKGMWTEAIELLKHLDIDASESMTTLLSIALTTNAKFEIIKYFLDEGAKLPHNLMFMLIMSDNSKLTEQLFDYDINLNYDDALGNSSIMLSVKYQSIKMFKLLIEQKIAINNFGLGFDALDLALIQFSANGHNTYYISELINAGALIKNSHKQLVQKIKAKNIEAYWKLLQLSPELDS